MPYQRGDCKLSPDTSAGPVQSSDHRIIERDGQCISIAHPCPKALRELTTIFHRAAVEPTHQFLTVPERYDLYRIENTPWGPQAVILAGLEPVVTALLEEAGYTVVIEPRSIPPLPPPRSPSSSPRPLDPTLLDFVRGRERGLIRLGPNVDPEQLVAQIHNAYPDATIAVAATRHDDVRGFGQKLKRLAPAACWSTGDDLPADPGPLVVSTLAGLGGHGVDLHRRDLLIFLHAHEALGAAADWPLADARQARLFGLTLLGEQPAPFERDSTWALFGFDTLDIPTHGSVARPTTVFTARIDGSRLPSDTDPIGLKRLGIWQHPIRNRRLVRLATALAAGNRAAVAAELPTLSQVLPTSSLGVLILVEGAEHAARLARLLPTWAVLVGPHVDSRAMPELSRSVPDFRLTPASDARDRAAQLPIITTLDGLAEVDLERIDALVRADGGVGVPAILAACLSTADPSRGPRLLVDFHDRHHPELRRRARDRRKAYLALGWTVDGHGGPMAPLDLFRATRPRGTR